MQTWRITHILLELLDSSDEEDVIPPLERVLIEDNDGKKYIKIYITFRHNVINIVYMQKLCVLLNAIISAYPALLH